MRNDRVLAAVSSRHFDSACELLQVDRLQVDRLQVDPLHRRIFAGTLQCLVFQCVKWQGLKSREICANRQRNWLFLWRALSGSENPPHSPGSARSIQRGGRTARADHQCACRTAQDSITGQHRTAQDATNNTSDSIGQHRTACDSTQD